MASYTAEPPLLYTISEASQLLRISRSRAYQLVAAGKLATVRIGASRRVPREALEAFVRQLAAEQGGGTGDAAGEGVRR